MFGGWIARRIPELFSANPVSIVPVPSKSGVATAESYRSPKMVQQALQKTENAEAIVDGLRWENELLPANKGGPRGRGALLPHLQVRAGALETFMGRPVILVDDLVTTGGSLLACRDRLESAGVQLTI